MIALKKQEKKNANVNIFAGRKLKRTEATEHSMDRNETLDTHMLSLFMSVLYANKIK